MSFQSISRPSIAQTEQAGPDEETPDTPNSQQDSVNDKAGVGGSLFASASESNDWTTTKRSGYRTSGYARRESADGVGLLE
jgi:hypothetical protein